MDQGRDKNWRELCQAAATEQDPNTLMMLVAEIIKTLDDRKANARRPVENKKDCEGSVYPNLDAVVHPKDQTCENNLPI